MFSECQHCSEHYTHITDLMSSKMFSQKELWTNPSKGKREMSTSKTQRAYPFTCKVRPPLEKQQGFLNHVTNAHAKYKFIKVCPRLNPTNPLIIVHRSLLRDSSRNPIHAASTPAYKGSVVKTQMDLTNTAGSVKHSNINTWLSRERSLGTGAELLRKFIQLSLATPHPV